MNAMDHAAIPPFVWKSLATRSSFRGHGTLTTWGKRSSGSRSTQEKPIRLGTRLPTSLRRSRLFRPHMPKRDDLFVQEFADMLVRGSCPSFGSDLDEEILSLPCPLLLSDSLQFVGHSYKGRVDEDFRSCYISSSTGSDSKFQFNGSSNSAW